MTTQSEQGNHPINQLSLSDLQKFILPDQLKAQRQNPQLTAPIRPQGHEEVDRHRQHHHPSQPHSK